jgi:hypothetical protein
MLSLAVVLAGCGISPSTTGSDAPTANNPLASLTASKKVIYSVTGPKSASSISYMVPGGQEQVTNAKLPFTKEFTSEGFAVFSLTAQNGASGAITCTITVDGQVVSTKTSQGQFAVVSCTEA